MNANAKWLKLQLKDDQRMESRYIILHTHFAIYEHLVEQGHNLACYEATNHERYQPNAVIYIKTDHEGFYKSCCRYYAHDFEITALPENFALPTQYRLVLGFDKAMSQLAS